MAINHEPDNYVLGRGEIWFDQFATGTKTLTGERYFGNTPEFNVNVESNTLNHYNSDRGVREKDASVTLEVNRSASIVCDNINSANLALFFFGAVDALTVASGTTTGEEIAGVQIGLTYQLGVTAANPIGVVNVTSVAVKNEAGDTTYVLDTDYELDADTGRIKILSGGDISDDDTIQVDYTTGAYTVERVVSGNASIEGAIRYIEYNPAGSNGVWYMPYVRINPNGDFTLKAEEWQQLPLSVEVLRLTGKYAVYRNGQPVTS